MKNKSDEAKTRKANSDDCDGVGNNDGDNNDDDVIVIQDTPKPAHKIPRGKLKSPGSAEYSYRRRRKSSASPKGVAVKLTPSKRCITDDLNTGFVDDDFNFLGK